MPKGKGYPEPIALRHVMQVIKSVGGKGVVEEVIIKKLTSLSISGKVFLNGSNYGYYG
jgi:hypothetical protein